MIFQCAHNLQRRIDFVILGLLLTHYPTLLKSKLKSKWKDAVCWYFFSQDVHGLLLLSILNGISKERFLCTYIYISFSAIILLKIKIMNVSRLFLFRKIMQTPFVPQQYINVIDELYWAILTIWFEVLSQTKTLDVNIWWWMTLW